MTGSTAPIRFIPYGEAYEEGFEDMPRRVPDISKIKKLVDFRPVRSIEKIVESVIDYHQAESEVRRVDGPQLALEHAF